MSTFPEDIRSRMFETARNINPALGGIFQNPMKVTLADLSSEIELANELKRQINNYIENCNKEFWDGMP